MRRIVVLGTSGSGKTTLASTLARRLRIPHIEMDAIHWKPNWTSSTTQEMLPIVDERTSQPGWVLDGNYRAMRELVWSRADTIIWLDYSMRVVFTRVFIRTMRRCWGRERLWAGNRESLVLQFCNRESILLWVITTWRIRRRDYPAELRTEAAKGKRILRFRSPEHCDAWLANLNHDCEP